MLIRELTLSDIDSYKTIRLELLKKHPENFGSSYEDEARFDDQMWINRISKNTVSSFGAFIDNKLVGICVIVRSPREKMKHSATLNSMYVNNEYRNKGIAHSLIEYAIKDSKRRGLESIKLSVVSINRNAYDLYIKLGFTEYGLEPKTIKYNDIYYSQILMSKEI